jgi:hypothetical protein
MSEESQQVMLIALEEKLERLEQSLREHIEICRMLFEIAFAASPASVESVGEV